MRIDYDYLIVGGGMAGDAAARGIRDLDHNGSIGILGADDDPPYERPPLSKDLWRDPAAPEPDLATAKTGAHMHTSTEVTSLDRERRVVISADGDEYGYRVLLLATGGRPRQLDLPPSPRVVYFRTLDDYRRTRALAGGRVVVVGGGFIGTELAAGLAMAGSDVTFLTSGGEVGAGTYPPSLTRRIRAAFDDHGVHVVVATRVQRLELVGPETVRVHATTDGTEITYDADLVLLGLGIVPNDELARAAGLAVDDGIVVDEHLRTQDAAVFAAGDVASYPDALLGRRRVEHVDHAQVSGRAAGRAMAATLAGTPAEAYAHTPFFYSDIFDLGYEAVGRLDASARLVEDWVPGQEAGTGVVYYTDSGRLIGVLLWNVWDSTDAARALLAEFGERGSLPEPEVLRGRIPLG